MRLGYKLTRSARQNLQQVSDYWTAEAGEKMALRIVTGIMETIITLSGQSRAGVSAERFGAGVRKFAAGNYIIYYRAYRPRGIEILHVFHGARDQRQAWEDERTRE